MGQKEWLLEMSLRKLFPDLTDNKHALTSPRTINYNCVAWAAQNTQRWWQPGVFWPIETSQDEHGVLRRAARRFDQRDRNESRTGRRQLGKCFNVRERICHDGTWLVEYKTVGPLAL